MNQFESNADAGEIFIRIVTAVLVGIQDSQSRRCSFIFVRQMMIGNDDVQAIRARPMQRLVRAYAAIDADD